MDMSTTQSIVGKFVHTLSTLPSKEAIPSR